MEKLPKTAAESHPGHNSIRLEHVEVRLLVPLPGAPRRFKPKDLELATAVMARLPKNAPLPISANSLNQIIVGELLVEAARRCSIKSLLIMITDGMTELEQKHCSAAITQLLTRGHWDPTSLNSWITEFEATIPDFSHLDLGFDNGELDKILGMSAAVAGIGDSDAIPCVEPFAVSRPGLLWQLGPHYAMVGDATNAEHIRRVMAGARAAQAITDPPFGCKVNGFVSKEGTHREFVMASGEMSADELEAFFGAFARNLKLVLREGALVYIFIDWRSLHLLQRACEAVFGSIVQLCCWAKDRAGMGSFYRSQHELVLVFRMPGAQHTNNIQLGKHGRNRSNVWDYPSAASSRSGREGDMLKNHPTPKPVEMIADAILDCTAHGEHVVDCFLGSGTTLIAAERTGRICHGMDLDPLHLDVAIRRWQAFTGLAAVDTDTGRTFDELVAEHDQQEGLDDD